MRKLTVSMIAACAAISLTVAGCGSEDATPAQETTTTVSSPVEASAGEEASTETAVPSQPGVTAPTQGGVTTNPDEIGGIQEVSGEGFAARIQVLNEPKMHTGHTLTFPVVIDVDSGSMNADPSYWEVRTLSGRTIEGSHDSGIPIVIASGPIDGHVEGLVTFFGADATESIVEVALYSDGSKSQEPIARWTLPTPVAVADIAALGE
ncbi:MAG: hypothetical protein GX542_12630 [Rhodococcus sp.]|nr:hypothetical protein [Rhodococcus sp. (in: high G+C Gram-positive bacteria)]